MWGGLSGPTQPVADGRRSGHPDIGHGLGSARPNRGLQPGLAFSYLPAPAGDPPGLPGTGPAGPARTLPRSGPRSSHGFAWAGGTGVQHSLQGCDSPTVLRWPGPKDPTAVTQQEEGQVVCSGHGPRAPTVLPCLRGIQEGAWPQSPLLGSRVAGLPALLAALSSGRASGSTRLAYSSIGLSPSSWFPPALRVTVTTLPPPRAGPWAGWPTSPPPHWPCDPSRPRQARWQASFHADLGPPGYWVPSETLGLPQSPALSAQ